jgi:tetratricopeptide (TPR) repeat protein
MPVFSNIFKMACLGCALVAVPAVCYGFDYLSAGMASYQAGDFKTAAQYFYSVAKQSPHNAQARYHLANCLVKLGRAPEAFVQYKATISLDPKSNVADYSRQALLVFKGEPAQTAAKKSHHELIAPPAVPTADPQEDDEQDIERAAKTVGAETGADERAISEEAAKTVKRITQEAAEKTAALEVEKQNEIASATSGVRWNLKDEIVKPIEQDYKNRIEALNKECKRRSDEVLADCKSRIAALENSATNSSRALIDNKRSSGHVRSIPLATNLHVRNYEIEEEPSGEIVPSLAKPAKSLQSAIQADQAKKK